MSIFSEDTDPLLLRFSTGGGFLPSGEWRYLRGAWDDDSIKKYLEVVFAVRGLTLTYRYPMATRGMGRWWDLQVENNWKKV